MALTVKRVNFSLPKEVDEGLDEKAQRCVEVLGKRNGRDEHGGWRSELVRAALERLDIEQFIAERNKAA